MRAPKFPMPGIVKPGIVKKDSAQFLAVCRELLREGFAVRFTAQGQSMQPNILPDDQVVIAPATVQQINPGQVVLASGRDGLRVHRMIQRLADGSCAITRGDAGQANDEGMQIVLGNVVAIERDGKRISTERAWTRPLHAARTLLRRLRLAGKRRLTRGALTIVPTLILLQLLAGAAPAQAVGVTLNQTTSVTTVSPGGQITYTDTLTNNSAANSVNNPVITQIIPTPTTYLSFTAPAGWTCMTPAVGGTTIVTCTDSAVLPANGTAAITVTVLVPGGTAGQTVISPSTTKVTSTTMLTGTTTGTSSITVLSASLSITESASPSPVAPGGTATFTSMITNAGASAAATPQLTFVIPTGSTYLSSTGAGYTCSGVAVGGTGTLMCTTTNNLANGATSSIAIMVTVSTAAANGAIIGGGGAAGGTATVTSTTFDPNSANNTATASTTVQAADLSMTQTAAPNPVATGATITYTETVTNNSTQAAAGATLTQSTPANTTFASAAPPTGWTCGSVPAVGATGTITCTANGTLAGGSTSGNFAIAVTVNAAAAVGSTITNTATVSENGTDPTPANNTTTTSVTVSGADLAMTQTASATAVAAGGTITYTETVTNNGPNAAIGATLYQQTPTNTVFTSITPPANWTCGTTPGAGNTGQVICTANGNIASGVASGNFTYVVTVSAGTASGTTITNTADVTSQTTDSSPSNNVTTTSVLVETTGDADLALTMTASPTPVFVSSPISYTIVVQNLGLAAGAAATVTDTLPTTLTNASATTTLGTCAAPASGKIVCTLGAVAYPLTTPITITVSGTAPASAGTLTNVASVALTTGTDPVTTNNSSTVLTVVQPLVCATPGKDGAAGTITGIVNTYYAGVGTAAAGTNSLTVTTPSLGAATQIGVGDLLLVIQMQGAQINSTNTTSYGDGVPGNPASGSTSLGNSGQFEFVTVTAVTANAGTDTVTITGTGASSGLLNSYASVAASNTSSPPQGIQTFQVIRVPQYSSATLSSSLAALPWNGAVGGVLALDVASQLTLGGTVVLDGQGFRGGGGEILAGGAGAATDDVTLSTNAANASKGEGIAGTPHLIAPALSTITPATTPVSTAQTYLEGLPNGSFARGAPGNAGGGATDAHPAANDQNSGGGAGGNGGAGGIGGFGWSSAGLVGGFGGIAFPATTSAVVMGGGGGAGTTNNGSTWDPVSNTGNSTSNTCPQGCTGIYSSGTAGGGIVIIHAGSVTGTGTISANGQTALQTENDGGGGAGAGGTILVLANSGGLSGLTASAAGGNGGITWPEDTPGTPFPGNRHGPGGGGGGGVIFTSSALAPGNAVVTGGAPGTTTLANDAYGAAAGLPGVVASNLLITETPGTQSGAYCAGADLAVTNAGTPNPVAPSGTIIYTQVVSNNGPMDALNAVFSEAVPASTIFQSITIPSGWSCNSTASILSTGNISCTDPDLPSGVAGTGTFTIVTQVNAATTFGTQIVDTANISSGTADANLSNNSATITTVVGSATNSAYVTLTKTAGSPTVVAGNNITYTLVMHNNGPSAAAPGGLYDTLPPNTTFVSISAPANWSCTAPMVGATGGIACNTVAPSPTFLNGATATFTLVVAVPSTGVSNGTVISNTANANSATPNPNPTAASATANVTVAGATQSDLAITSSAPSTPVILGNNVTFTQVATNNGPANVSVATYTNVLPTGTTFVSLVPPSGFTCTTPAVGSAGTVTCTGPLNSLASATFPLVLQVTNTDAPGTKITNTATIGPTTNDPNTANNTASSFIFTASPSQADVSIVKTATPEPVDLNTNLTYTLQVTNNGPAVAQNVNVSDPLPAAVIFTNVTTTQGSCTQSGGTVSCSLGTLGVGSTVVITINVNAATFSDSTTTACNTVNGVPYSVCNIASISSSTSDPDPANNSSEADSTIQATTAVQLSSFHAQVRQQGGVLLEWHTQEEIRNLGFNVYREDVQGRHRVNPSIIAGAALFVRGARPQHGAKTYYWIDPIGTAQSSYLLEDVDLNGTRSTHGPISPDPQGPMADQFAASKASISGNAQPSAAVSPQAASEVVSNAPLLTQLNRLAAPALQQHARALSAPRPVLPKRPPGRFPVSLDLLPALKIGVTSEGWYRLSLAQLIAAGFNPGSEPQFLQLFAEGVEQPMVVESRAGNRDRPVEGIEFYGTGIDTPFSGTRVYWLVRGTQPGKRVTQIPANVSGSATAEDFLFTVLLEERTTYFATLLNGENQDNFFGDAVTTEPVDEQLTIAHLNPNSALQATVDVTLQGGTDQQAHAVSVSLNGNPIGEMNFLNQANVTNTFPVNSTLLQDGINTVTLTALDGDNDVSLVQSIALNYPHTYAADGNWLRASVSSGATLNVTDFTSSEIYAYDITDPSAITQLSGSVRASGNTFSFALGVPNVGAAERTLLIFSADQISAPASLTFHAPDPAIHQQQRSDIVVISHPDFVPSLAPYVALRQQQGRQVTLVTVDQLFDAFNYGERTPFAIRDYLQQLSADPAQAPQAVLLVGDASLDPRNYLGFGDFDFVPTRIIETQAFKTASDDWFSDFQQTGFATIPTGRIPVRTVSDAALVISKIVNYESGSTAGSWNQQALLIADQNVDTNFTNEATFAATELPSTLQTTNIFADTLDVTTARDRILNALNNGALLVNYTGHGATEQWSFSDLLDDTSAAALTNGERLPFYLLMDCLNGFFQDVYTESLAESLLLAPNGGAVAVWASSGFTAAPEQATLDQAMLGILKEDPSTPVGESILGAKLGITDPDVRRTWILFGDPSMQLQLSTSAPKKPRRYPRSPIFKINNSVASTKEGN